MNRYLHAAVIGGVGIQVMVASVSWTAGLLGNAAIPAALWGAVFGAALLAWALAHACARLVWREDVSRGKVAR